MTALINTPRLVAPVLRQLAENLAAYDSLTNEPGALDPRARLIAVVEALLHGDEAELAAEDVAFLRSLGGAAALLAD